MGPGGPGFPGNPCSPRSPWINKIHRIWLAILATKSSLNYTQKPVIRMFDWEHRAPPMWEEALFLPNKHFIYIWEWTSKSALFLKMFTLWEGSQFHYSSYRTYFPTLQSWFALWPWKTCVTLRKQESRKYIVLLVYKTSYEQSTVKASYLLSRYARLSFFTLGSLYGDDV